MTPTADDRRELDVVVLGATGFVGSLVAEHLATHAPRHVRIGLAGRSVDKLTAVRARLPGAQEWPLLRVDVADPAGLDALARQTGMVVCTVGPYAAHGTGVVRACAAHGTHYADLTGEPQFVRDSIDAVDSTARATGARIVHSAGYDSIPSDLGVWDLARRVRTDGAGELTDTTLVLRAAKGGFSGGTVTSLLDVVQDMRADAGRRDLVHDPYTFSPHRSIEPDVGDQPLVALGRFDRAAREWVIPLLPLGPSNERVVRRTNALLGYPYGRSFRYRESIGLGAGLRGGVAATIGGVALKGAEVAWTRRVSGGLLDAVVRRVAPGPGSGPSEQSRLAGFFRLEIVTVSSTGARYVEDVAAQGDPGYTATAVMIGETAMAQVLDGDRLPDRAGVLTPAVAFEDVLLQRLRSAGMTFESRRVA